jgi:hypothetical protein
MRERVHTEVGEPDRSRALWHKSSYSNGQANCVEVATNLPGLVAIRDSKHPDGPELVVTAAGWRAFVASTRHGRVG